MPVGYPSLTMIEIVHHRSHKLALVKHCHFCIVESRLGISERGPVSGETWSEQPEK